MKTIKITNELYEKLINISREMLSQDNRSTASPYFFQVRTTEKVPPWGDNSGEFVMFIDDEGTEYENKEDFLSLFESHGIDVPDDFNYRFKTDLYDLVEEYFPTLVKIEYNLDYKYENIFFTESACKSHIESNSHNYNSPVDYISYAFRNPELEIIQNFLISLSKSK